MHHLRGNHANQKATRLDMSQTIFSTFFEADDEKMLRLTPLGAALIHQSMHATPKVRAAAVAEVQGLSKEIAAAWIAQKKANAEESGSAPKVKGDGPKKTIKKTSASGSKK